MNRPDPFADFDKRFAAQRRRFDVMHAIVLTLIAAIWIVVAIGFATLCLTFVRLGPDGIAAEAGRLVGVFERSWEQAR